MFGIRTAANSEYYVDVLYARREQSKTDHILFRGSVPVTKVFGNTRFSVGGSVEMPLYSNVDKSDGLIKLWIAWDFDLSNYVGEVVDKNSLNGDQ